MKKTTILLLIEGGYPWYRGGVSEWVYQYISHFKDVNFAIIQIADHQYLDISLSQALYSLPDNIDSLIRIPPSQIRTDWELEVDQWLTAIRPKIEPAFINCDIVHLTNTGFAGWLGMKMGLQYDKPVVLTEHALYWKEVQMGNVSLESGNPLPDCQKSRLLFVDMLESMAKQIYQAADEIISVSECNIPLQKSRGAKTVTYIPNGISEEWLLKSEKKRKNHLTIGWIGRCARMKNPIKFLELIDAFEAKAELDVSFLMLSCDANEPMLEQKLKAESKKHSALKLVWGQSAEQFIDQMDALCITSLNESQPLVLFEALSRKVLPVGWQTGDATDKYGIFVPPGTAADDLVTKITATWQAPDQWRRLVNNKYEFVAQNHLWGSIFEKYSQVFDAIQKEKRYA